jgi:hypothetical protein
MAREPLVQDRTPLNEVKFAARDFASIFDALVRRVKIQYGDLFNDFAETDEGVMLLDLCAYAAAQISWALDRVASDCFLSTVRTPMPAAWLARQLGYKVYAAAAAGADLEAVFADGIPGPCIMEAGWRFAGPEGIQFELIADKVYGVQAPGYTTTLAVRQGKTRQLTYVGDNTQFQRYNLEYAGAGEYIAEGSVRVWVDGAEWSEEDFLAYEATNQFEVDYQAVPPYVRFGDGKAGNVPATGADIRIEFVKIVGGAGNVKADTITTSLDTLSVGGVAVPFTVTNALPARSGRDAETVDHVRRTAPYAFASRGGAVTLTDYQAQANGFVDALYGTVAKAYATTPRTALADIVFNGHVAAIQYYITQFQAAVDAAVLAFAADQALINDGVAGIEAARVAIDGLRASLLGNVSAIIAGLEAARATMTSNTAQLNILDAAKTDADNDIAAMQTYIDGLTNPTQRAALTAYLAAITVDVDTMKAAADQVRAGNAAALASVDAAAVQANAALAVVADTTGTMAVQLAAQQAEIAGLAAPLADLAVQLAAMDAAATTIETQVDPELLAMQARVGELFDASCRTNLVQVPILSVDPDGEYIAPPSGLMVSLQVFLDGLKEVTQTVEVIDGSAGLIPATIVVSVHVNAAYVAAEVVSAIDSTVRGLMRGRDYAQALYLSDLYRYVRACSDGIEYCIVEITGPTAYLVGENLVPGPTQILTLGSLTITEIP